MTIFAASAIPIMIMGVFLESSKLVATLWLKRYWNIAPIMIKIYLCFSVVILMLITSMGIFGYLSKAHSDQSVPSSDIAAKVEYFDSQIKTNQDNIASAKKALLQMDRVVDETMNRSDSAQGTVNALYIRRSQTKERNSLNEQISEAQRNIVKLNTEKSPVASQLRTIEAEVGPIKYIAAFLYGDNVDTNILEKSVRAMIVLIVVVFDPLAVVLLLTSQYSFQYIRDGKRDSYKTELDTLKEVVVENKTNSVNESLTKQPETTIINKEEKVEGVNHELKLNDIIHATSHIGNSDTMHASPVLNRDDSGWFVAIADDEKPLAKKKFTQKGPRK